MRTRILTICAALTLIVTALPAQNEAADEAIDGLKTAFKEKIPSDIKLFLGKCVESWEGADDKRKGAIQKLVKKGLANKEREVVVASIEAASKMKGGKKDKWGAKSTSLLAAMTKNKKVTKDLDLFDKVCRGIGALANKKGIPVLTKLLKYKDFEIVAAAAESLAGYKDYAVKDKKEMVSEILKMYTSIANQARDRRNVVAQRRLAKIEKSMEMGLKTLTGQSIVGAANWQQWWNNTGKKAKSWSS